MNNRPADGISLAVRHPAQTGRNLRRILGKESLRGVPGVPKGHRGRGVTEDLLETGQGKPRLDPVNAEGMSQVMYPHIVQPCGLTAPSEHLLSLAVGEWLREHRISRPTRARHPMSGEKLNQRLRDRHVSGGAGRFEPPSSAGDRKAPLG